MSNFTMLEFFNPLKKRPVWIRAVSIHGFDYDGANNVNVIYTPGGIFPVQESIDEIKAKLNALSGQGDKNE